MARRRGVIVFGQSNCNGRGSIATLISIGGTRWQSAGVYQNLHYWQNDPFDFHTNRGRITPLDLSFYDDATTASENYRYVASQTYLTVTDAVPSVFGPDLEIIRGHAEEGPDASGQPPICIKLGLDLTFISPYEPVLLPFPNSDWWWPTWARSWHPSYPKIPTAPVSFSSAVHTGTATNSSTTTLVQAGAGWTVDAYKTKWVRATWTQGYTNNVLSATAMVISNTADTLTVAVWLGPTPSTTAAFSIYTGTIDVLGTIDVKRTATTVGNITATALTDVGAFTPSAHIGHWAIVGGAIGYITANTADTLTVSGWSPLIGAAFTIAGGAYQVADIRPGAGSFSKVLIEDYVGACNTAVVAQGHDGIDVQDIYAFIGESDSGELTRAESAYENMKAVLHYMRTKLVELGYTTLPAHKIRVVIALVKEVSAWAYASTTNAEYQRLEDNDPYVVTVNTSDFSYGGDGMHYDAQGCVDLGRACYEANAELRERESKSTTIDSMRLTLSDLRTRFRRRYERTTASNELTSPQVDSYLNDALRAFYNLCGDNAWFLRQIASLPLTASPGQINTLPIHVRRVFRVENATNPGLETPSQVVGYDTSGRTQLVLLHNSAGTYNVHYFYYPPDLSAADDRCIVPPEYIELVILYACSRASETAGNADHAAIFMAEAQKLEPTVKRDLVRYERPKKGALTSRYDQSPYVDSLRQSEDWTRY